MPNDVGHFAVRVASSTVVKERRLEVAEISNRRFRNSESFRERAAAP